MQIVNTLRLVRHSIRVGILSYKIANRMKLTGIQRRRLLVAGLLHDIGKIKLNQSILNKKGNLSNEEFIHIKQHVNLGVQILKKYKIPQSIYNIVKQHHETPFGTGYPIGLKDDEISIEAKILRTADVYDALTSNRSYRKKHSMEEAIEIMKRENIYGFINYMINQKDIDRVRKLKNLIS